MGDIFDFNTGWSFHAGDIGVRNFQASHADRFPSSEWLKAGNNGISKPGYPEDKSWREVNLPHDFVIEGEFSKSANYVHGSLPVGLGWYRKSFYLPEEDQDKRIFIEFDGIFRNSSTWVNGHFAGSHLSGYTPVSYDITDVCEFGANNGIAVRVDASEYELWSYEGGGIYRDVRLVKSGLVHVPQWGVSVTSELTEPVEHHAAEAEIHMAVEVRNTRYDPVTASLEWTIFDPNGEQAVSGKADISLDDNSSETIRCNATINKPSLWDIENPELYKARMKVSVNGLPQDDYEQHFGIRHIRFDSETGFYLNGRNLKLKGTCCHQDHSAVGIAVPAKLQEWRVRRLKEMGSNALRTSHNPADPALLAACDKLGMLVMDEQRMIGSSTEILDQLETLIRRGRNHPSVILWSLGNEEIIQNTDAAVRIFRRMQALAHRLDPSRPTTYAMNARWIETCDFHAERGFRFDVFGANYRSGQRSENYDEFHAKHPDWPMLGSETGGFASTRGLYRADQSGNYRLDIGEYGPCKNIQWTNPAREGFVSAYGETCTPWGYSIEETWKDCDGRPFMAGTFLWTGFDYRGETFPYQWPSVITRYGIMDLCGFPKDIYHYLRAWWVPQVPMVHIFPHWDWPGYEGEEINVWCFSNCASVELFVNGETQGRRTMEKNGHLEWNIQYRPGVLSAKGYDDSGKEIAGKDLRTPGRPAGIVLTSDAAVVEANGQDVVIIDAMITDTSGEWCQNASNTVSFLLSDNAVLLGVGNGNPVSLESDKAAVRNAYCGLCQMIIQVKDKPGKILVRASSPGLEEGTFEIDIAEAAQRPQIAGVDVEPPDTASSVEIDNLL